MGLSTVMLWTGGLVALSAVFINFPLTFLMSQGESATLQYLAKSKLQTIDSKPKNITASSLWKDHGAVVMVVRRPGCSMCREEALALSSLQPELDLHNVKLYAVLHETLGAEEFKQFFSGEVFLDFERKFYGPHERWMSLGLLLRVSVISNIYRTMQSGLSGDMNGEGRLLGGVFVIGPKDQGILFVHQEAEFGDHADIDKVLEAVSKVKMTV